MVPVTRCHIKLLGAYVRSYNLLVTVTLLDPGKKILQSQTQLRAFGEPDRQALAHHLIEHEELHLLAYLAVVTLLGLFNQLQILVQHLFLGETDTVYTGHLRTFLVSAPICGRCGSQLDCLDSRCIDKVGTAAEVCIITLSICGYGAVLKFGYQFVLVALTARGKKLQGIGLGYLLAYQFFLSLDQFLHLGLYGAEVTLFDHNSFRGHDVIIKALLYSRTYAELCAGPELLNCLSHKVSTGMPVSVLSLFILPFMQFD
ncbi:MAG: hypothetical protein BWY95_02575 [Bacteroidetes bacterium ADurb.BinA104]|nr:MAG: hypothetical protein BWY95_02575 [Bacteroidetes bacterium ADurb.BinA104]